ncbi:MAG: DUF2851 family protein [Alistipes sp.]|jgi:hypothetical protein|nr:DUF2851 family protein [Alistipes sp.]
MNRLLELLWRAGELSGHQFAGAAGECITVTAEGEQSDDEQGVWIAAEVTVDGERRRGPVAIGAETPVPAGAVLRVVADADATPVLGSDDRLVPQIAPPILPEAMATYDALRAGASGCGCASRIARMESVHRTAFYTSLLVERLQRKTEQIAATFESTGRDWHQTFHTLLLRAMGGNRNREAFTALAAKATSAMISREKSSIVKIEALLLGSAGFLFGGRGGESEKDDYTLRLEEEARHLTAKYQITPLRPAVWDLSRLYPANHPAVRLVEIAALLCKKDFMLDGVLGCRTSADVETLFAATASDYWRTHYTPSGNESAPSAKTIGRAKARLIGINLAAPLMFAYGRHTGADELCDRALDLLADIPAERNKLLDGWYSEGCEAQNGFESQALLQLAGEYCAHKACTNCRLGRTEIKSALARKTYTNNE